MGNYCNNTCTNCRDILVQEDETYYNSHHIKMDNALVRELE